MDIRNFLAVALKGFGMGAANVVPGVSGGTIALLTGIYSQIVDALDSFTAPATWKALFGGRFKEFWARINGTFILALGIGLAASILSLAKLMTYALAYYPVLTWAFFFGLILASVYYMLKDVKGWTWKDAVMMVIGAVIGVVVCTLSPTETPDDLWFIFVCGAVSICTMILPGISGSFVMVLMGKYEYIMNAIDIKAMNWPVVITFALGCVVGILAFAKLLHWLLGKWERQTMLVLIGFVLGSLVRVWPWADMDAVAEAQLLRTGSAAQIDLQIPWAVAWCIAGLALVVVIEVLASRRKS